MATNASGLVNVYGLSAVGNVSDAAYAQIAVYSFSAIGATNTTKRGFITATIQVPSVACNSSGTIPLGATSLVTVSLVSNKAAGTTPVLLASTPCGPFPWGPTLVLIKNNGGVYAAVPTSFNGGPDLLNIPNTIPGNSTISSNILPTLGWEQVNLGVQSSQAGSLIISRYADTGGNFLVSTTTAAMIANTLCNLNSTGSVLGAFSFTISNTNSSAAVVSKLSAIVAP